jgi:hypothetical protein
MILSLLEMTMRMMSIEVSHYWTDDRGIGFERVCGALPADSRQ